MGQNETTNTDEVFSLHASPSHLLHRAQQVAALQSSAALNKAGITLRQFSVLAAVSEKDGASQSDLVDMTGVDRSTLADMVQRMENSGLIRRTLSKTDARAKAVSLTAKGKRALADAAPAVHEADEQLLGALPKNRRKPFLAILSALTSAPAAAALKQEAEAEEQAEKAPKKKAKPEKDAPKKSKAKAKSKGKSKTGKKAAKKG